jgi:hypothetical protein
LRGLVGPAIAHLATDGGQRKRREDPHDDHHDHQLDEGEGALLM